MGVGAIRRIIINKKNESDQKSAFVRAENGVTTSEKNSRCSEELSELRKEKGISGVIDSGDFVFG